jgi:hypothetical protein
LYTRPHTPAHASARGCICLLPTHSHTNMANVHVCVHANSPWTAGGRYDNNEEVAWTVRPAAGAARLELAVTVLDTEPGYDLLRIYVCHPISTPTPTTSTPGPEPPAPPMAPIVQQTPRACGAGATTALLGTFSGKVVEQARLPKVTVGRGGWARVEWLSDRTVMGFGWSLAWQASALVRSHIEM